MNILAIDPGHEQSAYVLFDADEQALRQFGKIPNAEMFNVMAQAARTIDTETLVIEQIASFGMTVGAEVFETVFWSGRFAQAWMVEGGTWDRLKRLQVKMHLCHDSRAKDANIRQALIDRFGPGKDAAIGNKKSPGPLYGVSNDVWSALAVAVTWADQHELVTPGVEKGTEVRP